MTHEARVLGLLLGFGALSGEPTGCCTRYSREHDPAFGSGAETLGIPSATLLGTSGAAQSDASGDSTGSGQSTSQPPLPRLCAVGETRPCASSSEGVEIYFPVLPIPSGSPCEFGSQTCEASGRWGPCFGTVGPAKRDRCEVDLDDSNCDGNPNSGCDCLSAREPSRRCGTDVGACEPGTQTCEAGRWGPCLNGVQPTFEQCDGQGLDTDCDGKSDAEDPDCECVEGAGSRDCLIPSRKGDCALGIQTCTAGRWGSCLPRFSAQLEACGILQEDAHGKATGDEDCDGLIDEPGALEYALGCEYYIVDRDHDGYGAIGESSLQDPVSPTWGCFCAAPNPEWEMTRASSKAMVNSDCADCADLSGDTIPSAVSYTTEPSDCLEQNGWKGGPYDVNCDGKSEPRLQGISTAYCVLDSSRGKCRLERHSLGHWYVPSGNQEDIPGCGQKGDAAPVCGRIIEPGGTLLGCELSWESVRQQCR